MPLRMPATRNPGSLRFPAPTRPLIPGLAAVIPGLAAGLAAVTLALAAGCAAHQRPLPPVAPGEMPGAWLTPLGEASCPPRFEAKVRLDLKTGDGKGGAMDGTLRASLPDTLRLNARIGAFRPAFALFADADSCELLLHGDAAYWITPRGRVDWAGMNPSAWARGLDWAICPSTLIRQLEPDGPGTTVQGIWRIAGTIRGTPWQVELGIDPRRRRVRQLVIASEGTVLLTARMRRYQRFHGVDVPVDFDLEAPQEGLVVRAELYDWRAIGASDLHSTGMLRPAGWRPVPDLQLPAGEEGVE